MGQWGLLDVTSALEELQIAAAAGQALSAGRREGGKEEGEGWEVGGRREGGGMGSRENRTG